MSQHAKRLDYETLLPVSADPCPREFNCCELDLACLKLRITQTYPVPVHDSKDPCDDYQEVAYSYHNELLPVLIDLDAHLDMHTPSCNTAMARTTIITLTTILAEEVEIRSFCF